MSHPFQPIVQPLSPLLPRRSFLQIGSSLALLASPIAGPGLLAATVAPARALHSSGNLKALQRSLKGRLILPGDGGFHLAAFPNNARWAHVLPKAVALCADEADVQLCLRWAREHRQPFAVRSGGHSYAGFSTTTGLLISVRHIKQVAFDLERRIATVGAGASNQDIADVLRHTNLAIPSGRCPTVGVSGLVLGGGWGFSATRSGLTADSLLASNIVLADNRRAVARGPSSLGNADGMPAGETENADLFWALRGGGGGNFGVNTSFTFRLSEASPVTLFNILWPGEKQVDMLSLLQSIQLNHATQMSTRTKAYPDQAGAKPGRNQLQVATLGLFWGSEAQARDALAPALNLVKPLKVSLRSMPYWQARDELVTDDPTGLYDLRSAYIGNQLQPEGLEEMLRWMMKWPGGSVLPENMGILFAIGGKVRDVAANATAYVHRNANFIFEMECNWAPFDKPGVVLNQQAWLADYAEAMQPFVLPQAYVNFPSRDQKDWGRAYYGSNLERLSKVKTHYDPDNFFRFAQSVPRG
ncbi:MAG: hypothetical protein RLZZ401_1267 [Pseudomonadota bacterium]